MMSLTLTEQVVVSPADRVQLLEFAVGTVRAAGQVVLPYFRSAVSVANKLTDGGFDPVTEADQAAERVIRERIAEAYPAHGVFGEEYGWNQGNGLTWVIDPIDGTKSFMSGLLHWGVLLALFDGQQPVVGVMHQPFTGEVWAGDGGSAWYEHAGERRDLRARQGVGLAEAVLATTSPEFLANDSEREAFSRLESRVRLCRYGGDCYLYAMLAMGCLDLVVDGTLNAYDIQPLMPIIQGAGGRISLWNGEDAVLGGTVVAAGGAALHAEAMRKLTAING